MIIIDTIMYYGTAVVADGLRVIGTLLPVILPIFLGMIFWHVWILYRRAQFMAKQDHVLLEIKLPKEQLKSPLAMELFLSALNQRGGEATWIKRYIDGSIRPWFSLEIISIEGEIHFIIWTRSGFKAFIESQVYSQFPDAEVFEVDDYTHFIQYNPDNISLWGCQFDLVNEDVFPIKTYIDYGLDKDPKEEFKVDPMTPMMEFLGSLGPGEQVWYQILIQFHKERPAKPSNIKEFIFGAKSKWKKDAEAKVDEILCRDPKTKAPKAEKIEGSDFPVAPTISEGERDVAKAIERSVTKPAFDVGIRGIYLAEGDNFNPINITGLIASWRTFASENLNAIKPTGGMTSFSYPWQDFRGIRQNRTRQALFDAFQRRSYFYPPYQEKPFVFNTEELATIFHFPGSVAQTPTLKRIEAKKTEPPSNLPV